MAKCYRQGINLLTKKNLIQRLHITYVLNEIHIRLPSLEQIFYTRHLAGSHSRVSCCSITYNSPHSLLSRQLHIKNNNVIPTTNRRYRGKLNYDYKPAATFRILSKYLLGSASSLQRVLCINKLRIVFYKSKFVISFLVMEMESYMWVFQTKIATSRYQFSCDF